MLGGIQAVIWNDVVQFCMHVRRAWRTVVAIAGAIGASGGLEQIWSIAAGGGQDADSRAARDRARPASLGAGRGLLPSADERRRDHVRAGGRADGAVYVSDQMMVQRLQTTRSFAEARQAFIVNAAGDAVVDVRRCRSSASRCSRIFKRHRCRRISRPTRSCRISCRSAFPPGIVGLVIAVDHGGVAVERRFGDQFLHVGGRRRPLQPRLDEGRETREHRRRRRIATQVLVSRIVTVLFGMAGTMLAMNVSRIGSLLEIANKLINAFSGPLFGIYLLAMFSRRATSDAVLVAGVAGTFTSYYVAYQTPIGFMWPSTFGFAATWLVGTALTLLFRTRPSDAALKLTWRQVVRS